MPIVPSQVASLIDTYSDLTNAANSIVEAAAAVAPAAARDILCSIGGAASLGAGPFGSLQSPGTGPRILSDIGGILSAACPVPPPIPEPPAGNGLPPGTGQCSGIVYDVTFTTQEINRINCAEFERTTTVAVTGPILSTFLAGPDIAFCSPIDEAFIRLNATAGDPSSDVLLRQPGGDVRIVSFTIDSVTRQDGLPDDCGDPNPPAPPRPPITQPPDSPPIPTEEPDGSPGPDIIIKPRVGPIYVDIDGHFKIPVVVNFEGPQFDTDISIPVTVNLPDFSIDFGYGGSGGGTSDPTEPDEPTPPEGICCDPPLPDLDPGEEEDPEDPPPEEEEEIRRITGIVITSAPDGGQRSESQLMTANPTLLVPRIATVQFEVRLSGSTFLSSETSVKSINQYVPAPRNVPVTRAFVGFEPGWAGDFSYVTEAINPSVR